LIQVKGAAGTVCANHRHKVGLVDKEMMREFDALF